MTPELFLSLWAKFPAPLKGNGKAGLSGPWHGAEAEDVPICELGRLAPYLTYGKRPERSRAVRIAFLPHATGRATNIDQELKNCLDLEQTDDYITARLLATGGLGHLSLYKRLGFFGPATLLLVLLLLQSCLCCTPCG